VKRVGSKHTHSKNAGKRTLATLTPAATTAAEDVKRVGSKHTHSKNAGTAALPVNSSSKICSGSDNGASIAGSIGGTMVAFSCWDINVPAADKKEAQARALVERLSLLALALVPLKAL